jgi:hypothetical protein
VVGTAIVLAYVLVSTGVIIAFWLAALVMNGMPVLVRFAPAISASPMSISIAVTAI